MTVHNIKISHSVCCADSVSKQNETHPSTDIIIKDYMSCEHSPLSFYYEYGGDVSTKSWFDEFQPPSYGIRPPLIKEIYAFTSLIGIPVKTTETTYNYKVSNQQNVNPAHAEYLEGAGKQDDNILYPRVDQLLTLMEWLQDLNEFHGWGLPKFKKFSSIDLTGAEFDPVGINFDDFIARHKLNTNHSLGFVQLRDGNTIDSETVTFNSPDYTQRTLSQYELFGENWHFTKMLYQIVDWLNQLAELHGLTYWEDLLSIGHLKVAKDRNQIGNTWRGWRQYTEDVAQESYEYGKFSFKDYQVLFPQEMDKVTPNYIKPITTIVTRQRIVDDSTYVPVENNLSSETYYWGVDRIVGGYRTQIRLIKFKFLRSSPSWSDITWPPYIDVLQTTSWEYSTDYHDEDTVKNAIIELGFDCTEISMSPLVSVGPYYGIVIASFTPGSAPDGSLTPNDTNEFIAWQFKLENVVEPNRFDINGFTYTVKDYNLRDHFDSCPSIYTSSMGSTIDSGGLETDFRIRRMSTFNNTGTLEIVYPEEEVAIGFILLNKLSFIQRFGIRTDDNNKTCVRVKQFHSGTLNSYEEFYEDNNLDFHFQLKVYFGFSSNITQFVNINETEESFSKIKDILESGTEVLSVDREFPTYDETIELDLDFIFGSNSEICMFFGHTKLIDPSKLDGVQTNTWVHKYNRIFGITNPTFPTLMLENFGMSAEVKYNSSHTTLDTYPYRVRVNDDNDIYRPSEANVP